MPITPEDIQQVLSSEAFNQALSNAINPAINGVAASLKRDMKAAIQDAVASVPKAPAEEPNGSAETQEPERYSKADKALLQRLEAMEKEREAERAEALASKRKAAISDLVSSRQLNQPELVKKLLTSDYGNKLVEENGAWYVEDGENVTALSDVFESFLKTEGSYFLPASGTNGAGTKESRVVAASTKVDPDREAALKLAQMAFNLPNQ